jgi:transcriptional regulator GlxA family with amidase domain
MAEDFRKILDDRKYEYVSTLGAGAFGLVIKAVHVPLGVPVAMKILHPDAARTPEDVERIATAVAEAVARQLRPLLAELAEAMRPATREPRYLSLAALAELVGVSKRTAQNWVTKGLPVVRPSARVVRVDVAAARTWIDAGGPGAGMLETARKNAEKARRARAA